MKPSKLKKKTFARFKIIKIHILFPGAHFFETYPQEKGKAFYDEQLILI